MSWSNGFMIAILLLLGAANLYSALITFRRRGPRTSWVSALLCVGLGAWLMWSGVVGAIGATQCDSVWGPLGFTTSLSNNLGECRCLAEIPMGGAR